MVFLRIRGNPYETGDYIMGISGSFKDRYLRIFKITLQHYLEEV